MHWIVVPVVALAATALVLVGRRIDAAGGTAVARQLRYQPVALGIAIATVLLAMLLVPDHADVLAVGDLGAPASGLGWLGVADGTSWREVGLTFLVITGAVTAVTVWLQVGRTARPTLRSLATALPWAVGFSIANALSEELIFRAAVVGALSPAVTATAVAATSAVLFGVPHYFGNPGRLPGVLLAGFLGWFLALSVLQTGGLGWALAIHACLDVIIITTLIASSDSPVSTRAGAR